MTRWRAFFLDMIDFKAPEGNYMAIIPDEVVWVYEEALESFILEEKVKPKGKTKSKFSKLSTALQSFFDNNLKGINPQLYVELEEHIEKNSLGISVPNLKRAWNEPEDGKVGGASLHLRNLLSSFFFNELYNKTLERVKPDLNDTYYYYLRKYLSSERTENDLKQDYFGMTEDKNYIEDQPLNPFKGFKSYQIEDGPYYFGRKEEVREYIMRLNKISFEKAGRKMFLFGAAGSGKSSFVQGGLLYTITKELERDEMGRKFFKNFREIEFISFKPGYQPLLNFSSQFSKIISKKFKFVEEDQLYLKLLKNPRSIESFLPKLNNNREASSLYIFYVDQLEEMFTKAGNNEKEDDQVKPFIDILNIIANKLGFTTLLIATYKSAFGNGLIKLSNELFDSKLELFTLKNLEIGSENFDIKEAIEKPFEIEHSAQKIDSSILTKPLVEKLVKDFKEEKSLALLNFTLYELWEKYNHKDEINIQDYQRLTKDFSSLFEYFNSHADNAFTNLLSDHEREIAIKLFVNLARSDQESVSKTTFNIRDLIQFSDSESEVMKVLDVFGSQIPLITFDNENIELIHDEIPKLWKRYNNWLKKYDQELKITEKFENDFNTWFSEKENPESFPNKRLTKEYIHVFENNIFKSLSKIERGYLEKSLLHWNQLDSKIQKSIKIRSYFDFLVPLVLIITLLLLFSFISLQKTKKRKLTAQILTEAYDSHNNNDLTKAIRYAELAYRVDPSNMDATSMIIDYFNSSNFDLRSNAFYSIVDIKDTLNKEGGFITNRMGDSSIIISYKKHLHIYNWKTKSVIKTLVNNELEILDVQSTNKHFAIIWQQSSSNKSVDLSYSKVSIYNNKGILIKEIEEKDVRYMDFYSGYNLELMLLGNSDKCFVVDLSSGRIRKTYHAQDIKTVKFIHLMGTVLIDLGANKEISWEHDENTFNKINNHLVDANNGYALLVKDNLMSLNNLNAPNDIIYPKGTLSTQDQHWVFKNEDSIFIFNTISGENVTIYLNNNQYYISDFNRLLINENNIAILNENEGDHKNLVNVFNWEGDFINDFYLNIIDTDVIGYKRSSGILTKYRFEGSVSTFADIKYYNDQFISQVDHEKKKVIFTNYDGKTINEISLNLSYPKTLSIINSNNILLDNHSDENLLYHFYSYTFPEYKPNNLNTTSLNSKKILSEYENRILQVRDTFSLIKTNVTNRSLRRSMNVIEILDSSNNLICILPSDSISLIDKFEFIDKNNISIYAKMAKNDYRKLKCYNIPNNKFYYLHRSDFNCKNDFFTQVKADSFHFFFQCCHRDILKIFDVNKNKTLQIRSKGTIWDYYYSDKQGMLFVFSATSDATYGTIYNNKGNKLKQFKIPTNKVRLTKFSKDLTSFVISYNHQDYYSFFYLDSNTNFNEIKISLTSFTNSTNYVLHEVNDSLVYLMGEKDDEQLNSYKSKAWNCESIIQKIKKIQPLNESEVDLLGIEYKNYLNKIEAHEL